MRNIQAVDRSVTTIIIAHRLSTLKGCDNIYELTKGTLKSYGSYNNFKNKKI
jgi:ABC-type bacteriocin/lantibiotic exporter with double-glycine peptidase domain